MEKIVNNEELKLQPPFFKLELYIIVFANLINQVDSMHMGLVFDLL